MEITIYVNGQPVSVEVSVEVYAYLNEADHKDENLLHEQRRHWDGRELEQITTVLPSQTETPEEQLCRKETLRELMAVLDSCTALQRERFLLYALEGMSYAEIAKLHGCTKHPVRDSIVAVRKKYQEIFKNRPHEMSFSGY